MRKILQLSTLALLAMSAPVFAQATMSIDGIQLRGIHVKDLETAFLKRGAVDTHTKQKEIRELRGSLDQSKRPAEDVIEDMSTYVKLLPLEQGRFERVLIDPGVLLPYKSVIRINYCPLDDQVAKVIFQISETNPSLDDYISINRIIQQTTKVKASLETSASQVRTYWAYPLDAAIFSDFVQYPSSNIISLIYLVDADADKCFLAYLAADLRQGR